LTATAFDITTQSFSVSYTTVKDNQTGTWTASIQAYGYGDGYGNYGPTLPASTSPQLQPATLSVAITTNTNLTPGQPIRLNATIAAAAFGIFLTFRRRKVTHARLKIDLEAIKTEAGKIEEQDFFKSIKGQLKKDEEESR